MSRHFSVGPAALILGLPVTLVVATLLLAPSPTPQAVADSLTEITVAVSPPCESVTKEPSVQASEVYPISVSPSPTPTVMSPPLSTPGDDEEIAKPATGGQQNAMPAVLLPAPRWSPEELQASLLRIPEVSLHPPGGAIYKTGRIVGDSHPLLELVESRPDLHGLAARSPSVARLPQPEADAFRDASVLLRKELSILAGQSAGTSRRLIIRPEVFSARPDVAARVMHQMLQAQGPPIRKMLLAQLKQIRNPAASRALAHRAVFDPIADLRQTAVKLLVGRPVAEYLPVLLEAFANPWPPAADYAADALVSLAQTDAVPELIAKLDTVDTPGHELVRVNHSRNCLLCHAQSVSTKDGVRMAVPSTSRPLPPSFSLATYEGGGRGGSGSATNNSIFVRPDITYFQQDFSWVLPVANPGPWPSLQRYDFLVRKVSVEPDFKVSGTAPLQKLAIVRALQALTGKNFGERAADWRAGLTVAMKN